MKYADLIRAALDGKKIQWRQQRGFSASGEWTKWNTFPDMRNAVACLVAEYTAWEYREEPPPPVVTERWLSVNEYKSVLYAHEHEHSGANVKLTFTNGVLTNVELVK